MKKEKEVKEKKEIKETVKDYTIEKQDQKRLKGISKALYIIAKIFKIVSIIGIVGLFIAMIAVPIVTTNIKTLEDEDQHILRVFDHDFYYNRTNTTFEIYEKDKIDEKTEITKQSDVEAINKVFDYLEENDLTKATIFVEVEFALYVAVLFVSVMVCNKVYSFFKNIHDKDTPFTIENIDLLKNIGKLLIISFIISSVASIISSAFLNYSYSISLTNVIEILVVYCALYIFKYAYKIQEETKGKIYSE